MSFEKLKEHLDDEMDIDLDTIEGKLMLSWRLGLLCALTFFILVVLSVVLAGKSSIIVNLCFIMLMASLGVAAISAVAGGLFISDWAD